MSYEKEREEDYARRRGEWPEDGRISNIGQNGNTGDHYTDSLQYFNTARETLDKEILDKKAERWFKVNEYMKSIQETVMDDVPKNKYHKKLAKAEVFIDVYDVLDAYKVENPAIQHAIKKMLCAGTRGYKDFYQDIQEAIDSLERAKDFPPVPF